MDLKQTAALLGWSRDKTKIVIENGIYILPGQKVQLNAECYGNDLGCPH
jgi:hypothetical protein